MVGFVSSDGAGKKLSPSGLVAADGREFPHKEDRPHKRQN
jgi:hypothetical protein